MTKYKLLFAASLVTLLTGSIATTTTVSAQETSSTKSSTPSYYSPPSSTFHHWESPFDYGNSRYVSIVKNGYVYSGTIYKRGASSGWVFVYEGTLYLTPNTTASNPSTLVTE